MTKERTSLSLEPEVAAYLKQDQINASGLVNNLIEKQMAGGLDDGSKHLITLRLKQVRSEIESLESRVENKRAEEQHLESLLEQHEQEAAQDKEAMWSDALSVLDIQNVGGTTVIKTEDRFIESWADRLGLSIDEFKSEAIARSEEHNG